MQKTKKKDIEEMFSLSGKKILGINPPVHDFSFFDLWSKPVGLLYLLEKMKHNNNDIALLDCIHEGAIAQKTFGREKIYSEEIEKPAVYSGIKRRYHRFGLSKHSIVEKLLAIEKPEIIFLTSVMTYWYGGVKETIDLVHQTLKDVPVVLGGVYARLCPEHASTLGADYIITDNWQPDVPYPAMDLYEKIPYGVTMTSFGCPMSCEYCASRILWPKYHRRSIAEVLLEIDYQKRLGAVDFAFYDDALLIDKEKYAYPLVEELTRRYDGTLRLHTPNGLHVREIDSECAEILKKSGFVTIRLSLESIDPDIVKTSCGKVARNEYATAINNLLKAGYSTEDCETYILLGLPEQSIESVKDTIKFVRDCGGKPKLAEFSPIPGTSSFAQALKKIPNLATEPLLQNNSVYSSWISGDISPKVLQELKDLARG